MAIGSRRPEKIKFLRALSGNDEDGCALIGLSLYSGKWPFVIDILKCSRPASSRTIVKNSREITEGHGRFQILETVTYVPQFIDEPVFLLENIFFAALISVQKRVTSIEMFNIVQ